jgi:hypothetical protein
LLAVQSSSTGTQKAGIDCKMKIKPFEYGQAAMTLIGKVRIA